LSPSDTFLLPKLKRTTIGNLPVKPPQRNDLTQRASSKPGAIQESGFLLLNRLGFYGRPLG
jgi:hypothetical protein